jgi:ATP-dependent Clp protease adaptor protein ClpS
VIVAGQRTGDRWRTTGPTPAPSVVRLACDAILWGMSDRLKERDDTGVITQTRTERKLKKPKMYKVLLLNDDYTTMEFVVFVLQSIFQRAETEAVQIMLHVHKNGMGVAGVYTREIAETRVAQVEALAREHEFPLRCSMEEA